MEYFALFFGYIIAFMKIKFEIFGFELSFWGIFVFTCVTSIVLWFIGRFFLND